MSEEERQILPDPSSGARDGVILFEEAQRDDRASAAGTRLYFHRRAKILSERGREMASIELPFGSDEVVIDPWWGRTLLPDGTLLELPREGLKERVLRRASGREVRRLVAELPGAAPGCVIDYGYALNCSRRIAWKQIPLQHPWPVRQSRYLWVPRRGGAKIERRIPLSCRERFDFDVSGDLVRIIGHNVPPIVSEPLAPPESEIAAKATFSNSWVEDVNSSGGRARRSDFWGSVATDYEKEIDRFLSPALSMKGIVSTLGIPKDAGLALKLRLAYDWLLTHVENTSLPGSELPRQERVGGEPALDTAKSVLAAGRGTDRQIDWLFMVLARALGAAAHPVLVTDRTDHYWDPLVPSAEQLDFCLVAVGERGAPREESILLDPGSGLPYGQIPWFFAGGSGLFIAAKTGRAVAITTPKAFAKTEARVAFASDARSVAVEWSRKGWGQQGLVERLAYRGLDAAAKKSQLGELCGAGRGWEITRSEVEGFEDLMSPWSLHCGCRASLRPEEPREVGFSIGGPWIQRVPELPDATRVNPVVFDFPYEEMTVIEVAPPPGYVPGDLSRPIDLKEDFGRYTLATTRTPDGYRVERGLAILRQQLEATDYARLRSFLEQVRNADETALQFKRPRSGPPR